MVMFLPAGGASVPRAPGLADLPNVTQADFWLNRASVHKKEGNLKVHCLTLTSLSKRTPMQAAAQGACTIACMPPAACSSARSRVHAIAGCPGSPGDWHCEKGCADTSADTRCQQPARQDGQARRCACQASGTLLLLLFRNEIAPSESHDALLTPCTDSLKQGTTTGGLGWGGHALRKACAMPGGRGHRDACTGKEGGRQGR